NRQAHLRAVDRAAPLVVEQTPDATGAGDRPATSIAPHGQAHSSVLATWEPLQSLKSVQSPSVVVPKVEKGQCVQKVSAGVPLFFGESQPLIQQHREMPPLSVRQGDVDPLVAGPE